jgi:uncharacterized protein GlcG (DUF336 family)
MFDKCALVAGLCLSLLATTLQAAEEKLVVQVSRLTMETALKIAQGAVQECRKQGVSIGVAVVDRDGVVQAVLRDTVAPPITLRISQQKAFTAANFQALTSDLERLANGPVGRVKGLTMSAGGVPIEVAGQMLGGVGVSGAPSGATDEACARAGIATVRDELEMSL